MRLVSACSTTKGSSACSTASGGGETAWTYDNAGNRTSQVSNGVTSTYTYNAAEQLTSSAAGTTTTPYSYDKDGNQLSAGSNTYQWNAADEMTQAATSSGTFTYTYDSGGNLSATRKSGILSQTAVWDINAPLPLAAEQQNSAGATTADYTYQPDGALATMKTSAGTYQAITDQVGSVTGVTSSSAAQVTSTTYAPFGAPTTTGTAAPSIGFADSYTQPGGTSLDDMRARDYNPATGDFTSADPLLATTGQPYAYADGNPVSLSDPSGLISWGFCLSGLLNSGIGGTGTVCPLVITYDWGTGVFQFGSTETGGWAFGVPAYGPGIGEEISSADCLAALRGAFGYISGSARLINGQLYTGGGVVGAGLSLGPSLGAPSPIEVHGGVTWTATQDWFNFNYGQWIEELSTFGLKPLQNWLNSGAH
jgi:RHS repeat-associated protein